MGSLCLWFHHWCMESSYSYHYLDEQLMSNQPESRLSRQIINACTAHGAFVYKVVGGPRTMRGLPDITGVYKRRSIWFEVKMPGNSTTVAQDLVHERIRQAGGLVRVVYSVQEALALLNRIDHATNRVRGSTAN